MPSATRRAPPTPMISCILMFLLVAQVARPANMYVHSIDVGQGAATLFEFSCKAMLVDTGGESNYEFDGRDALMLYLDEFFARRSDLGNRIDTLILTHPHIDHTNGVKAVLAKYPVDHIITNGQTYGSGRYGQLDAHKYASGPDKIERTADDVPFTWVRLEDLPNGAGLTGAAVDSISCADGDPEIAILWGQVTTPRDWGTDRYGKPHYKNNNNHSLAVRVRFGQASMLITGDMEEVSLKEFVQRYHGTQELNVDVYEAGHHGSVNGTIDELALAMTPKVALIHMGPEERHVDWSAWKYGHPRRETIATLERNLTDSRLPPIEVQVGKGATRFQSKTITKAIYATGWDGDIVLEANDAGLWRVLPGAPSAGDAPGVLAASGVALLNINTASVDQLVTLPRIGPTRAQAIVDHRSQQGPFRDIHDLENVRGIGPATSAALEGLVRF